MNLLNYSKNFNFFLQILRDDCFDDDDDCLLKKEGSANQLIQILIQKPEELN